jgi:hypothetical protein
MSLSLVQFLAVILLVLAVIVIGPFMIIWSINTLFPVVNIPYTLETWGASAILFSVVSVRPKKG